MPISTDTAHVYAPEGPDLDDYLRKIDGYNTRTQEPTRWRTQLHTGADFLDRFAADRRGDVVVISGNNRRKTEYLSRAVAAGVHTLADKPMAIDKAGFAALDTAFATARDRSVLLYDIMTERHEITTMLQKEFSTIAPVFGGLVAGIDGRSRGHQGKRALLFQAGVGRPAQAAGVVLRHRAAGRGPGRHHHAPRRSRPVGMLPGRRSSTIARDVRVLSARALADGDQSRAIRQRDAARKRSRTILRKDVQADGSLHTYANGEINYAIRGVHAKVSVIWNFEAPPGAGDTHYSVMRGTQSRSGDPPGRGAGLSTGALPRAAGDDRYGGVFERRSSARCRRCRRNIPASA